MLDPARATPTAVLDLCPDLTVREIVRSGPDPHGDQRQEPCRWCSPTASLLGQRGRQLLKGGARTTGRLLTSARAMEAPHGRRPLSGSSPTWHNAIAVPPRARRRRRGSCRTADWRCVADWQICGHAESDCPKSLIATRLPTFWAPSVSLRSILRWITPKRRSLRVYAQRVEVLESMSPTPS